jgi:hypothetical protein
METVIQQVQLYILPTEKFIIQSYSPRKMKFKETSQFAPNNRLVIIFSYGQHLHKDFIPYKTENFNFNLIYIKPNKTLYTSNKIIMWVVKIVASPQQSCKNHNAKILNIRK